MSRTIPACPGIPSLPPRCCQRWLRVLSLWLRAQLFPRVGPGDLGRQWNPGAGPRGALRAPVVPGVTMVHGHVALLGCTCHLSPVLGAFCCSSPWGPQGGKDGTFFFFKWNTIKMVFWFLIQFILASLMVIFSAPQLRETALCSALLPSAPGKLQDLRCLWAELCPCSGLL